MVTLHVLPAYGRNYNSKKAIEADLLVGKDFLISSFPGDPDDGRYVNLADLQREGRHTHLQVRYGRDMRKVTIVEIPGNS